MTTYRVTILPEARKDLGKLHPQAASHVLDRLEALANDPRPRQSEALKGDLKGLRRLRVGRCRAVYLVDDKSRTVSILAVAPRGQIYRRVKS